jgi:protein-S-isoprenylcysteine O-methyltransferase Ste14
MRPSDLFIVAWVGWIVTWTVAAFWTDRTEKSLSTWDTWAYRASTALGLVLVSHFSARTLHLRRIWHVGYSGAYLLVAATVGGILFAWWARIHLGRLWSGSITRKEGHHVIDTGPYGLVRHPIYTGLIAATLATAVAEATATALIGFAVLTFGLWLKARAEERFLSAELGPDDYAAYQRRVPMLVPFSQDLLSFRA